MYQAGQILKPVTAAALPPLAREVVTVGGIWRILWKVRSVETWEGTGKGGECYRMSPSEIQCDGNTKMSSIGELESLGLWLSRSRT